MPGAALSLAFGLTAGLAGTALAAAATLAPLLQGERRGERGGERIGDGWRVLTLPQQRPPVTTFVPERVPATAAGRPALRIEAQRSYGNLLVDLPPQSRLDAGQRLAWSWRVQKPNASIDLHKKTGDDSPAKVCLSFDVPIENLPFGERQQLRMAHALTGQTLPMATLCWVWGGPEVREALIENPYTRRVRYIVLRNGSDALSTWFDESRDVAADFKRAFGDESPALPAVTAVLVGADADNTLAHSVAHIAALRLVPGN